MHTLFRAPVTGSQVILEETSRDITPYGGLCSLMAWFTHIGLVGMLRELLPCSYYSPNSIPPEATLLSLWLTVCTGGSRFSHAERLRPDAPLSAMSGVARFPCDDTLRNFFNRFGRREVDSFFPELTRRLLALAKPATTALDLDSTVICRHGEKQQGALGGYNPRRPGRASLSRTISRILPISIASWPCLGMRRLSMACR